MEMDVIEHHLAQKCSFHLLTVLQSKQLPPFFSLYGGETEVSTSLYFAQLFGTFRIICH